MVSIKQRLLITSVVGWTLILVGSTILGLLWPEYDTLRHTVSGLGSIGAPNRWIMNTIFAVDGILLASYGISFMKLFKHRWRDISTGHFLTLSGVLLFLLAFFPGGRSLGDTVMTQDIHNTIAAILIVSFVFAPLPFIIRMAKQPRWRRTLIIVGVISVIKMFNYTSSVVVLLFSGPISEFGGLFQKLGLILDAIWIIFVTIQIKRLNGIAVV